MQIPDDTTWLFITPDIPLPPQTEARRGTTLSLFFAAPLSSNLISFNLDPLSYQTALTRFANMADKLSAEKQFEYGSEEKHVGLDSSPDGVAPRLPEDALRTVDAGLPPDQVIAEIDEAHAKRVMRKIDLRLIPLLTVLYL